jgi:hypothetical protein
MRKTTFIGLTALGPEDSIFADGAAFTTRDRDEIDRGLKIGIKTHRHTGLAGLSNPSVVASAQVVASGGSIDSGLTVTVGYTLEDAEGGETMISPLVATSTPIPLDVPLNAPVAVANYTAGTLLTDTYTYAITFSDGEGGETPLGPSTLVTREPGFENAKIELSGLSAGMGEVGAEEWRLYRARGGGEFALIASGDESEDAFVDDGSVSPDCSTHPPTDNLNNTNQVSSLVVTLPSGLASGATFINLYATTTGSFDESSLLAQYPIASAGRSPVFRSLEFLDSQPPDVNRSYGGAPRIDPDSEIIDFHWKRPVAGSALLGSGEVGDVKLDKTTGQLYGVLSPKASAAVASDWSPLDAPRRAWASASLGSLASGASGTLALDAGFSAAHLLKLSTNKRMRVRVYGDEEARTADLSRPIGQDPKGDHGVQLDHANTVKASGAIVRITPIVHAANLDLTLKNRIYLTVDNFDATGQVVVAFLYLPLEVA